MKVLFYLLASLIIFSCGSKPLDVIQYRSKDSKLALKEEKVITLGGSGSDIVFPTGYHSFEGFFTLMDPAYAQKCYTFFPDGGLRGVVGGNGQGPGEYKMPWAMTVSKDRIFVASGTDKKMNVYDLNGQFLESNFRDFTGIISSLAPYGDGVIGAVYSRYCDFTLFTTDRSGKLLKTMLPRPKPFNHMFDTIWPAGGLLVAGSELYQFNNFAYAINILDEHGKIKRQVSLASSFYQPPDLDKAEKVKGIPAEKEFRSSYTPMSGLFAYNQGFITVLSRFDGDGNEVQRLEFWDKDFNGYGYVTLENQTFIGVHEKDLVFFENQDLPRLHFVALTQPTSTLPAVQVAEGKQLAGIIN